MDDLSQALAEYEPRLKTLARRIYMLVGRRVAMEDLEQLGRIGAARAITKHQPERGPKDPWVLKCAEQEMMVGARTERRQNRLQRMVARSYTSTPAEDIEQGASMLEIRTIAFVLMEAARDGGRSPEEEYCTEEARALLPVMLSRLPEGRKKQTLELILLKKMEPGEVAKALAIEPSRVSHYIRDGAAALKAMFDSPPALPEP